VRKGTTTAFIAAAIVVGAIAVARSCSDGGGKPSHSQGNLASSGAPKATATSALRPPGGPRAPGTAAGEAGVDSPGGVVFFSPWGGSTKDQVGRERPREGNPMGPMSLTRDAQGRLYVLDQVNGRVVRHGADGKPESTTEVKLTAAQDLAIGKDGSMAVLDRIVDKSVALYDDKGVLRGQLALQGDGVDETGFLTGVFIDGTDVYVEREHGPLVRIGDTSGAIAQPRTEIPGRPSRDGLSFLNAGITDAAAGRAYVASIDRASGEHRFTRELRMKAQIQSIQLLDSDKSGKIYFAVELHEDPATEWILLQCLEPLKGAPEGSALLPANTLPEETFRDLTVLDDGGVIYALRSESGVTYQRYDCN
jgi:hypothetical protein